ncbi:MAG: VWA domain-containing protein [bacterium]
MMRIKKIILVTLVSIVVFSGCSGSGEISSPGSGKQYILEKNDVFVTEPSVINILFRVKSGKNRYISNLTRDDFIIQENGTNISDRESFARILNDDAIDYQQNILFLFDVSTSITLSDIDTMKTALRDFIRDPTTNKSKLDSNTLISIMTFSGTITTIVDYTNNVATLLESIDTIKRGEATTDLYGAYIQGLNSFADIFNNTQIKQGVLILITDGKDQAGMSTLEDALSEKKSKNVYVIHLESSESDLSVSSALASGDNVYRITTFDQISAQMDILKSYITAYANSFYYLLYASPKRSGEHNVSLSLKPELGNSKIVGSFNADNFSTVEPEILLYTTAQSRFFPGQKYTLEATVFWTQPEDLDEEEFIWSSNDDTVLEILETNATHYTATVDIKRFGNVELTIDAPYHNLRRTFNFTNTKDHKDTIRTIIPEDGNANSYSVAVEGNVAYVADDYYGLIIIDISTPSAPKLITKFETRGRAHGVAIKGNYAYVTDYSFGNGLQVIDISNPKAPVAVADLGGIGKTNGIVIDGDYAYIAALASGLKIIDISNPGEPELAASYDTIGAAQKVSVKGAYAYVAADTAGLQIIDISDPSAPKLVGSYDTSGNTYDVCISGDYAYLADGPSGLYIIDIGNPSVPELIQTFDTTGKAYGVILDGNYAYVADETSGLQIIDITDPTAQTLKQTYDTNGTAQGVALKDNYIYIADRSSGLQIITLHDIITDYLFIKDN